MEPLFPQSMIDWASAQDAQTLGGALLFGQKGRRKGLEVRALARFSNLTGLSSGSTGSMVEALSQAGLGWMDLAHNPTIGPLEAGHFSASFIGYLNVARRVVGSNTEAERATEQWAQEARALWRTWAVNLDRVGVSLEGLVRMDTFGRVTEAPIALWGALSRGYLKGGSADHLRIGYYIVEWRDILDASVRGLVWGRVWGYIQENRDGLDIIRAMAQYEPSALASEIGKLGVFGQEEGRAIFARITSTEAGRREGFKHLGALGASWAAQDG